MSARELDHYAWPFFEDVHRTFARDLDAWAESEFAEAGAHADVDAACRASVAALGRGGWLAHAVAAPFGARERIDSRTLCLARETLAYHEPLADFAFAMQGLGSAPLGLAGSAAVRDRFLPGVVAGETIAAFALSEPDAGSDVAALTTRAARANGGWRLDGVKTWISNGGIADFYIVFARTDGAGSRGISAFVVPADAPGLEIAERIETIAPHPLARLVLRDCRVSDAHLLGEPGTGFKLAMRTLDIFRASVAAAALGMARRALDETLAHVRSRRMFGATLAQLPLAQAAIATMASDVDASALLTYRAAWKRDVTGASVTREAAMAKLVATETAQRTIDRAVQLFGARGVTRGSVVERLYREIRALRIYEGASEVQQLIVARETIGRIE